MSESHGLSSDGEDDIPLRRARSNRLSQQSTSSAAGSVSRDSPVPGVVVDESKSDLPTAGVTDVQGNRNPAPPVSNRAPIQRSPSGTAASTGSVPPPPPPPKAGAGRQQQVKRLISQVRAGPRKATTGGESSSSDDNGSSLSSSSSSVSSSTSSSSDDESLSNESSSTSSSSTSSVDDEAEESSPRRHHRSSSRARGAGKAKAKSKARSKALASTKRNSPPDDLGGGGRKKAKVSSASPRKRKNDDTSDSTVSSDADSEDSSNEDYEAQMRKHVIPRAGLRDSKAELIARLLCRWWYAIPDWPPPDFDYEKELRGRGYKLVAVEEWEKADDQDTEGLTKVYAVSNFPGVFRDPNGTAIDCRPLEGKPCFSTFKNMSEVALHQLLIEALSNQLEKVKDSPYRNTEQQALAKLTQELEAEKRRAEESAAKLMRRQEFLTKRNSRELS